jgi:hypothetical protein
VRAAAVRAPQIGEVVPLSAMEPGAYVELVGGTVRYDDPRLGDIPLFCARVRVMSQLRAGTFVEGWIESQKRWGGMAPAPFGAIGRLVDRQHVTDAWKVPA